MAFSRQQKEAIGISVIRILDVFTENDVEANADPDSLRLEKDLGISRNQRMMLAVPFTKVSKSYRGKAIEALACADLDTVKDCIELVIKQAGAQ
jgi:hypothetical protein